MTSLSCSIAGSALLHILVHLRAPVCVHMLTAGSIVELIIGVYRKHEPTLLAWPPHKS